MTIPEERMRALLNTRDFLEDLMDASKTPRVPAYIRKQARSCLKHFPYDFHLEMIPKAIPDLFGSELTRTKRKKK